MNYWDLTVPKLDGVSEHEVFLVLQTSVPPRNAVKFIKRGWYISKNEVVTQKSPINMQDPL